MKVVIQSIKFDADKKLLDFVTKKVEKLDKFFDGIVKYHVTLKLGNSTEPENKRVEIRVAIPGNDLFAERKCKTFEESTRQCVEALKQQVKKAKEKMRNE
ncbi:MAG: ribosome-associated translation inhibitor RaiA [Prevotellaceae bacterium]|jgi:putative sigma-54 modulation protein|nr:ribosome-associated translation inhibitor RaiA [Prevotellaceae bacterium]